MMRAHPILFATALVVALGLTGCVSDHHQLVPSTEQTSSPSSTPSTASTFAKQAELPPFTIAPQGPYYLTIVDPAWASATALATGIPETALRAYADAAAGAAQIDPACGIGWNTIAALGKVESDHGQHGGSVVGVDGTVSPAIFGVVLDGGSTANIPDTDGGAIDGISDFDRAVGPLQIIPSTWRSWNIDGSGDNIADPQNLFDSAFAAANYLCFSSSGPMTTPDGWRSGIAAYNAGADYLAKVAAAANRYLAAANPG